MNFKHFLVTVAGALAGAFVASIIVIIFKTFTGTP